MNRDRLMTRYTLLLIPSGILINLILSNTILHFEIPLFFDSIGTILAAVLGGFLPGIFVGFFSNVINGINDPITLYYGIISIFIAVSASFLAPRRYFNRPGKAFITALWFALLGGVLGSVVTWLLYGFSFGSGISAPFAIWIHSNFGISEFLSQFIADMGIDIADKIISVAVVYAALLLLPAGLLRHFPDGEALCKNGSEYSKKLLAERKRKGRKSLRGKVVLIIVATAAILGTVATFISFVIYKDTMTNKYIHTNSGVIDMMLGSIDADKIDVYLSDGVDEGYITSENRLDYIRDSFDEIEFMYVYKIEDDGCHVVFDLDTPDLEGEELGTVIPFDTSFEPYINDLLAGKEIEPIISDDTYGWLLTIYKPIVNSDGQCVAYAAADISMNEIVSDRAIFIIKMISLQFGVAIIIAAFTVWFAEKKIVFPINAMTDAASDFAYDNDDKRVLRSGKINSLNIHTGDELENLYHALVTTSANIEKYITDIREPSELIQRMQENTIVSFASMVENRDNNTGEHIKHTAGFVRIIAEEMKKEGIYPETVTDDYIENIVKSAPLHDIGKITVSDTILNKPGKLTDEEFAVMKKHTTSGRDILVEVLSGIDGENYLRDAIDMAAYHHEKWNGFGYPEGLSGHDIPLSARIMAVADVFDALISKRSYKDAFPFDKACEIIHASSCEAFDPSVVAAFEAAADSIRRTAGI